MQESTAYKRIVDIMDSGALSREECGVLMGRLSVIKEHSTPRQESYKPRRNPNHNPNITMIRCSSK